MASFLLEKWQRLFTKFELFISSMNPLNVGLFNKFNPVVQDSSKTICLMSKCRCGSVNPIVFTIRFPCADSVAFPQKPSLFDLTHSRIDGELAFYADLEYLHDAGTGLQKFSQYYACGMRGNGLIRYARWQPHSHAPSGLLFQTLS